MSAIKTGNPILVVFREVMIGDIKKIRAESNISPTGGGARDLRFRQGDVMTPVLKKMFSEETNEKGVVKKPVYWVDKKGETHNVEIEFWRPTDVRPNEVRLGKINNIKGWFVDEIEYNKSKSNGKKWFFLLVLDSNGIVWARLFQEEYIEQQDTLFKEYLKKRIRETRGNSAVFGSIDFTTLETIP